MPYSDDISLCLVVVLFFWILVGYWVYVLCVIVGVVVGFGYGSLLVQCGEWRISVCWLCGGFVAFIVVWFWI